MNIKRKEKMKNKEKKLSLIQNSHIFLMIIMYITLILFVIFIGLIIIPILINVLKYPEANFIIKNREVCLILMCSIGITLSMRTLNLIPTSMKKIRNKLFLECTRM